MKYKNNDYELLYLIGENNEDAKDILYKKYKEAVLIKVKKCYPLFRNYGVDFNDLVQEAMIGFTNALNKFNEQRNVEFATFANKCIDLQLKSYRRVLSNNKNRVLNDSLSVSSYNNEESLINIIKDNNAKNPESIMCSNEQISDINKIIVNKMTTLEKNVFYLKSKGCSYKEICGKLNITIKSAQHAYNRAKNKLENLK